MIPAEPVGWNQHHLASYARQGSPAAGPVSVSVPHACQEPIGLVVVAAVITVALISPGHDDTLAGDQHAVSQVTGAPAHPPRQCGGHHQGGEEQTGGQAGLARDALHREECLHEAGGKHDRVDHIFNILILLILIIPGPLSQSFPSIHPALRAIDRQVRQRSGLVWSPTVKVETFPEILLSTFLHMLPRIEM